MCIVCRGGAQKYFIKAEASKTYIETVTQLKKEQASSMGLHYSMYNDTHQGRALKGYVKLCATWATRFWKPELEDIKSFQGVLDKPSKIFDDCGAVDYNIGDDGLNVPFGS